MIFSPRIFYSLLALLAVAAVAQPAKQAVEPAKSQAPEPARDPEVQQRRATLRASLKSQPEVAIAPESVTNTARLMSAQERADLRQQLRQQ